MDREQELKAAAENRYPMIKGLSNSNKIAIANQRSAFKQGAQWEAERERSVSVEQAKAYTNEWLKNNHLWGIGLGLDFDDIFLLMADFANTNPTKNK